MWNGIERRQGADWVDVSINVFNITAWFVFVVALVIFHYARPEFEYVYYQYLPENISVRNHWQSELKTWLMISLYVCCSVSAVTLLINRLRLKRKTDRERYGMYMLTALCIVFIGMISV